jgi:hypothetical protein
MTKKVEARTFIPYKRIRFKKNKISPKKRRQYTRFCRECKKYYRTFVKYGTICDYCKQFGMSNGVSKDLISKYNIKTYKDINNHFFSNNKKQKFIFKSGIPMFKKANYFTKLHAGQCLSSKYFNSRTKMKWKCKEGHIWETVLRNICNGSWCPKCAGVFRGTIKDMQKTAKKRGGICLSKKYINSQSKLKWKCKDGHDWMATPAHIQHGTWCPKCAIEKDIHRKLIRKAIK